MTPLSRTVSTADSVSQLNSVTINTTPTMLLAIWTRLDNSIYNKKRQIWVNESLTCLNFKIFYRTALLAAKLP